MRGLFFLILLYLLALACSAQVMPGLIAASTNYRGQTTGFDFTFSQQFTVTVSDRLQRVEVTKHESMQSDYDDLRFISDPSGTIDERLYLPYWIESSDVNGAIIWVAFKTAPEISSTFTMVWGDASASAFSSGYRAFDYSGYYFNDFSRGINYDVVNVIGGYDKCLSCDPNGEETWPARWQDPNDLNHIGIIYKRQDSNLHAGNPTTRTAMKVSTDAGETWSAETVIDNPGSQYDCTSSTSIAIPTTHPSSIVFTTQAGLPWLPGDLGQARASDTQYFDFTVTSYSGTTLTVSSTAHLGTGTLTTWIISDQIGATNATITAVDMGETTRLIMLNSHINYNIVTGTARVGTKYSDDWGETWSTWTQRGVDSWINVGGQAITMQNGYCVFSAHKNTGIEGATQQTDYFFITRDYGVTWDVHGVQLEDVQLDEAGMFQKKNPVTWEWIEDEIKVIVRQEDSPFHFHTFDLHIGEDYVWNTFPIENNFYVDEQSRGTYTWADNRIWGAFGDTREQMVYSDDSGETWHPIPFFSADGASYSARRVYTVMWYFGNGKMLKGWSNNKLSGGADLYLNYWDTYNMALRAVSTTTLTDSRTRPFDLSPGLRINGSLVDGYRTASTTSVAIPTSHPTQVTFTVEPGLLWAPGDAGTATRNISTGANRFTFTVDSYSGTTLIVNSVANTLTGTFADWIIDKTSNFLSEQMFCSTWNRNGKLNPFRIQFRSKSPTFGGGFFGLKKDETRATATVTISNPGEEGDEISIEWSTTSSYAGLFTGVGQVARYTVQQGDGTAEVVAGLVLSANAIGICTAVSSTSNSLTLQATRGENTNANTRSFTITTFGDIQASSGTFSGGAQVEGTTTLSNIIHFDAANNVVRIEQANDNHNQALTATKNVFVDYTITWADDLVTMTDGTTTRTKNAATGSGIPDWEGHLYVNISTSASSPFGFHECEKLITLPEVDTDCTPGSVVAVELNARADGQGIDGGILQYVAIPSPPTFADPQTLVQATTGNAIQSADTGGKTDFRISGNYPFMQYNGLTGSYRMKSINESNPSVWSILGSPSPNDYALTCAVNSPLSLKSYNILFNESDNTIKWALEAGVNTSLEFHNCIATGGGFASWLINESVSGADYGYFYQYMCRSVDSGGESDYLGRTGGSSLSFFVDGTRIEHFFSENAGREHVQLNGHANAFVTNVTGINGGTDTGAGIGQNNGGQFQNDIFKLRNSILSARAPMMIAATKAQLVNNYIGWTQTDRAIFIQDMSANSYEEYETDGDTLYIRKNIFDCPGYTLPYVLIIQEEAMHIVIEDCIFPAAATDIIDDQRGSTPYTITMRRNIFTDNPPRPAYIPEPETGYSSYGKLVITPYFYLRGMGFRTPHRP